MKNKHFPILLEQDEDGIYIASCPIFKGCHSYGENIDEALENIKEAIELCLEDENASEVINKFIGIRDLELVPSK
jgi:predicted RNase H-like HicB family nuclease